jgi:hypothetical protein
VDLVGLAGLEVARERIKGSLRIEHLERLTKQKGVKVAIVYDRIFNSAYVGVPRTWIKVGQWTIRDNYICGDDTVAFFAVDPAEKNRLIANLRQFASRLPPDITQSGEYAE